MDLPFERELEGIMEEFRKRREHTAQLQRSIREISATGTTPRQSVKVKVGAQGDLLGIDFPTSAYKRMTPNELSEAILTATAEAKTKARDSLRDLMTPELPAGLDFDDLIDGKADMTKALSEDRLMPDAVRDYIHTGRVPGQDGSAHV
jgi:DNA-binding protein YbaB